MNNDKYFECERMAAALASIGDGVIFTDTDGIINFINKSAEDLTGWSITEVMNKHFDCFFPIINIDTNTPVQSPIIRALEASSSVGLKSHSALIVRDGDKKYVSASCSPIKDADNKVSGVVIVIRDISRLTSMEENLRQERNNLKMVFDTAPVGMLIVNKDIIIKEANKAVLDKLNLEYSSVINKRLGDGFQCLNSITKGCGNSTSCTICNVKKQVEHVFSSGMICSNYIIKTPLKINGKEVSRWLKMNFAPIILSGEEHVMVVAENITEQKEREELLVNMRDFYVHIFDNFPAMIWQFKLNGNIVYLSKNVFNILGLPDGPITMTELLSYVHPEDFKKIQRMINSYDIHYICEIEARIRYYDGEYRWIQLINKPLYNMDGKPDGYIGMGLDIHAKKLAENNLISAKEQAEAANKAKSEFLANMSHEIRTPINGIVGMIELTMITNLTSEQQDNLKTAQSCANNLLAIINDILDFSKMEANKMSIEDINFDLRKKIEEVFKEHSYFSEEKGLEFSYTISSGVPQYLSGDPKRLKQILNNLVGNAIKFTDSGEVNLSVRKIKAAEDSVELKFSVSDTGIGISSENQKKLFKTFSQVDGSITRKYGGTGLGLVISRQLVEIMGGHMSVESEQGKGSTFSFAITFKLGKEQPDIPISNYNILTKSYSGMKILLAEDDMVNKTVITRMLKEKGFSVDTASDGVEALNLYDSNNYDLILMDIQMPLMDGIETTKRIREKEGDLKHTLIVAITAYALQGDRERFLSLGMDEYLSKPILMSDLYNMIEKMSMLEGQNFDISSISTDDAGNISFVHRNSLEIDNVEQSVITSIEEKLVKLKINFTQNIKLIEEDAEVIKKLCADIDAYELKNLAFQIQLAVRRNNIKDVKKFCDRLEHEFLTFKNIYMKERDE